MLADEFPNLTRLLIEIDRMRARTRPSSSAPAVPAPVGAKRPARAHCIERGGMTGYRLEKGKKARPPSPRATEATAEATLSALNLELF